MCYLRTCIERSRTLESYLPDVDNAKRRLTGRALGMYSMPTALGPS